MNVFTLLAGLWLVCLESINSQITMTGVCMSWVQSFCGTHSQRRARFTTAARELEVYRRNIMNCNSSGCVGPHGSGRVQLLATQDF